MKGVFAGLIEPSRVALLDNADKLLGVGGLLGVDGATGLVATTFPLLGVSGGVAAFSIFSPRCKVSGVVMFTEYLVKKSLRSSNRQQQIRRLV